MNTFEFCNNCDGIVVGHVCPNMECPPLPWWRRALLRTARSILSAELRRMTTLSLVLVAGCGGAEFSAIDAITANDSGADAPAESSDDDAVSSDAGAGVEASNDVDAELRDTSTPDSNSVDSGTCAFDGGHVSSISCGAADIPANFRQHMNNSGTCTTRATPSTCQCVSTYTCACVLAHFVSPGSTTACPSDNVPTGCTWDAGLLVVECPFP